LRESLGEGLQRRPWKEPLGAELIREWIPKMKGIGVYL